MVKSSHRRCSKKKVFLKISQNSLENTCARVSFLIKLQALLKKETLAQVFSCEFCETFKSTFFHKTPPDDCFHMVKTQAEYSESSSKTVNSSLHDESNYSENCDEESNEFY